MFDPSDVDCAMRLAAIATRLAKLVLESVDRDRNNLLMGRDESIFLAVTAREVLEICDGE